VFCSSFVAKTGLKTVSPPPNGHVPLHRQLSIMTVRTNTLYQACGADEKTFYHILGRCPQGSHCSREIKFKDFSRTFKDSWHYYGLDSTTELTQPGWFYLDQVSLTGVSCGRSARAAVHEPSCSTDNRTAFHARSVQSREDHVAAAINTPHSISKQCTCTTVIVDTLERRQGSPSFVFDQFKDFSRLLRTRGNSERRLGSHDSLSALLLIVKSPWKNSL